jgi:hypothetical protein
MRAAIAESWVVYSMPMKGSAEGIRAVCVQSEWDAMEVAKPGAKTLVRAGIWNEGEAERLARGTSGAATTRSSKTRLTSWPGEVATALTQAKGPMAG